MVDSYDTPGLQLSQRPQKSDIFSFLVSPEHRPLFLKIAARSADWRGRNAKKAATPRN